MAKVFEDYFSELQADMVDICLQYVQDRADKIYIYGSYEETILSASFFYEIQGKVLQRHKINDADSLGDFRYDISTDLQKQVLRILLEDIDKIHELCKKYKRETPTEMKLIYDVKKNSLDAHYKYDIVYTRIQNKTANDIADEWFEEIKNQG